MKIFNFYFLKPVFSRYLYCVQTHCVNNSAALFGTRNTEFNFQITANNRISKVTKTVYRDGDQSRENPMFDRSDLVFIGHLCCCCFSFTLFSYSFLNAYYNSGGDQHDISPSSDFSEFYKAFDLDINDKTLKIRPENLAEFW